MGRRSNTPDFNRSNRIHATRISPTREERELTQKLIQSSRAGVREAYGQKLLNLLCQRLHIPPVRLQILDIHQPHKKQAGRLAYKEYGAYFLDDQVIRIANLTAVRGKVVAGKTFFDTLIHEFMHHLDRKLYKIPSTPHSPGFYNRIDDLKQKLMGRGPEAAKEHHGIRQWAPPPKGLMAALNRAAAAARYQDQSDETNSQSEIPKPDPNPVRRGFSRTAALEALLFQNQSPSSDAEPPLNTSEETAKSSLKPNKKKPSRFPSTQTPMKSKPAGQNRKVPPAQADSSESRQTDQLFLELE